MTLKKPDCFKEMRDECDKVYVSWIWLVGILVVLAGGLVGAGVAYTKEQNLQDAATIATNVKIDFIINDIKLVKENNAKLDTLLNIARKTHD